MLARRQIRAKVAQALYSHQFSKNDMFTVEKSLKNGVDRIYDLYIFSINLMVDLQHKCMAHCEADKSRRGAENENLKFYNAIAQNQMLTKLAENRERFLYTKEHQELTFHLHDEFVQLLFDLIVADSFSKKYVLKEPSFNKDKIFCIHLFEKIIAPNEKISDFYETFDLYWNDSISISNTMVLKTLQKVKEPDTEEFSLLAVYKNLEDEKFLVDLFRGVIANSEEIKQVVEHVNTEWDYDRINKLDLIIINLAITEFLYFESIPTLVTLNEYIEIAKEYSTEKSKVFINGLLDKVLRYLKQENKINKIGRGLL